MTAKDLRLKIQRQAEKLKSFHKKVKENKKKNDKLISNMSKTITWLNIELERWKRHAKGADTQAGQKHEIIIDLQRSLLRVTGKWEDEKAKNVISEVAYLSEIKSLNKHIDSLAPKKESMLKTSAISKIIKNTGDKNGKELQEAGIPR